MAKYLVTLCIFCAVLLPGCKDDSGPTKSSGAKPAAPSTLGAASIGASHIELVWKDNSANESGFKVERSTGASTTFKVIAGLGENITTFTDSLLEPATLYKYRVKAFNNSGNSGYSNMLSVTTAARTAIAAPTELTATAVSASQIDLKWRDNSDNETGFKIERAAGTEGTFKVIGSVGAGKTVFEDTKLAPFTSYRYRIRAVNASHSSDYSKVVTATTMASSGLGAPSNLVATPVSATQINLSWTDNASNETGFKIERAPALSNSWTRVDGVAANVTEYQDKGLAAATSYKYRVMAFDGDRRFAYSNEAQATTPAEGTPPAGPFRLTATAVSTSQINLVWMDPADNEDGFKIERAGGTHADFTEIAEVGVNVTTYDDKDLQPATLYSYRVRAFNTHGHSGYSGVASATTKELEVKAPVLTGPETSTGTFTLTMSYDWPFLASNWDCYELEESTTSFTDGFTNIHKSPAGRHPSPYTVDLTRRAGTYYYRARVYAGAGPNPGHSAYSEAIRVTVQATQVTRFVNNTSYPIVSLQVDGVEQFPASPYGIVPGNYYQLPLNRGSHHYRAVNGFWDGASRFEMYNWTGSFLQPVGATQTITFNDPTINQLLTRFQSTGTWEGSFWQNLIPHTATFKFTSSGTWTLYVDGNYDSQGNYTLVRRQPETFSVVFSIGPYQGTLYETLGYFVMENGPADWKIIEYYYQGSK